MALFAFPLVSTASVDNVGIWVGAFLGLCALVGLLWKGWRISVRWSNRFDAVNQLIEHELNHNSGSSMKDKSYEAVTIATQALEETKKVSQSLDRLNERLDAVLVSSSNEHVSIWKALHGKHSEDSAA